VRAASLIPVVPEGCPRVREFPHIHVSTSKLNDASGLAVSLCILSYKLDTKITHI
jgi:hypothetical protein